PRRRPGRGDAAHRLSAARAVSGGGDDVRDAHARRTSRRRSGRRAHALEPGQPDECLQPGDHAADRGGYWQTRFTMILLAIFAAVALALANAGIYAVISYLAAQRTREIGIRIALGARPPEVLWMIVTQALRLGGAGVACGLAASLASGRVLASRLYGV